MKSLAVRGLCNIVIRSAGVDAVVGTPPLAISMKPAQCGGFCYPFRMPACWHAILYTGGAYMQVQEYSIWEDDQFVYVPEALFEYLPKGYLEAVAGRKQDGEEVLRIVDDDIRGLISLLNSIPTTSNLSYIFHRLRNAKFEPTTEALMEQEMLTTAFIVTYGRLFAKGSGATGVSRKSIPGHLRAIHDEIIELRNKRYAHNASHHTVGSSIRVDLDDNGFHVQMQGNFGFYIGGKDEWEELVTFIDALMH